MFLRKKLLFVAACALSALPARLALAADDLQKALHDLDTAAANFRSTSTDFEFVSNMTDPIPDKDVLTGTAYYERKGVTFSMSAHAKQYNGKPDQRTYLYSNGQFQLFMPALNQVTTYQRASAFESYIMLGFGASGKDLQAKWDITDDGPETVNNVKTEKLELVAKDPTVRKNFPKVTVWIDTARAVSIRQIFDEGQGASRVCNYSNIKVNAALPSDAFKLNTDSKTTFSRQ